MGPEESEVGAHAMSVMFWSAGITPPASAVVARFRVHRVLEGCRRDFLGSYLKVFRSSRKV